MSRGVIRSDSIWDKIFFSKIQVIPQFYYDDVVCTFEFCKVLVLTKKMSVRTSNRFINAGFWHHPCCFEGQSGREAEDDRSSIE